MASKFSHESHWIDNIPPVTPAYSTEVLFIGIILLTMIVAAFLYYIYRRPVQQAKRQLRRLARDIYSREIQSRQIQDGSDNLKPICFDILACLRMAYSQRQLDNIRFEAGLQQDWQKFVGKISRFCYARQQPAVADLQQLIIEAQSWLNRSLIKN